MRRRFGENPLRLRNFSVDTNMRSGYDLTSLEVPGVTALLPFERCVLGRAELVEEVWWLSLFCS